MEIRQVGEIARIVLILGLFGAMGIGLLAILAVVLVGLAKQMRGSHASRIAEDLGAKSTLASGSSQPPVWEVKRGQALARLSYTPFWNEQGSSYAVAMSWKGPPRQDKPLPRGTNADPYRQLEQPNVPSPPIVFDKVYPIVLRRYTWRDKLGKLLFINREVVVGDPAFDGQVYVETSAPVDEVKTLLAFPELRAATLRLLALGWQQVILADGDSPIILKSKSPKAKKITSQLVFESIALVAPVVEALPPIKHRTGIRPRDLMKGYVFMLFMVISVAPAAPIFASFGWGPIDSLIYWHGALGGLALCLVLFPVLVLLLRGRASSLRLISQVYVLLLFLSPSAAIAAAVMINGLFDSGRTLQKTAKVLDFNEEHSIDSDNHRHTSYSVVVATPWSRSSGTYTFAPSASEYARIKNTPETQRFVTIPVHKGALGYPWYGNIHLVSTP